MMTDLQRWRMLLAMVGKREAYRLAHNAEYVARPLWLERPDGEHRLWSYSVFVAVEKMCAAVSKGVRDA